MEFKEKKNNIKTVEGDFMYNVYYYLAQRLKAQLIYTQLVIIHQVVKTRFHSRLLPAVSMEKLTFLFLYFFALNTMYNYM